MGLADSPHFLRMVRQMVQEPHGPTKAWAQATDASQAAAYRIVRFFRFHGALPGGRVDARRLLLLGADLRRDRAVPDLSVAVEDLYEALHCFDKARYHLAFASAANEIAFFEPEDIHVRLDEADRDTLQRLKEHKSRGKAGDRVHIYLDRLDRYPPPAGDRLPACDPLITLMDLHSHPRAGAHAAFLDDVLTRAGMLPERPP